MIHKSEFRFGVGCLLSTTKEHLQIRNMQLITRTINIFEISFSENVMLRFLCGSLFAQEITARIIRIVPRP